MLLLITEASYGRAGGVSFGLIQPQESIEKENHDAEVDEVADLVVSLGQQYIVHKSVTSV